MSAHQHHTECLVIGAGVSGLMAANYMRECSRNFAVLESCQKPGGLTRSVYIDGYVFDYSGHLLHLAHYAKPSDVPYAGLEDDEWIRVTRDARCLIGNRLVTAPVQYHLNELESPLREECMQAYQERATDPKHPPRNFHECVVQGFGSKLAECFLVPQNEKTWATSLDGLTVSAARRFLPPPDPRLVQAGMVTGHAAASTYNSHYWYPARNGIQVLADALARPELNIHYGAELTAVDLERHLACTRSGATWSWQQLVTTMPLRAFCQMTGDRILCDLARELRCCSTVVFNVGLRSTALPDHAGVHWIYVPDKARTFYRVGYYSHICSTMAPGGCCGLYVEVGLPDGGCNALGLARLQHGVIEQLCDLGWISADSIACISAQVIACGYTHQTLGTEQAVKEISERLALYDVHPAGRYGRWDYMSMEDAMVSTLALVEKIR